MTLFLAIFLTILLLLWSLFWITVCRDEFKKAYYLLSMPRLNRPYKEDIRGELSAPPVRESPADHILGVVTCAAFVITAGWASFAVWRLYAAGLA